MNRAIVLMGASFCVIVVSVALLMRGGEPRSNATQDGSSDEPVVLYCAASNRSVIEQILTAYRDETGRAVDVQYGPSQTLLSQLEVARTGDLYLPADDAYLDLARDKDLVAEQIPIAEQHAVLAVAKGNPQQISSFNDLLRDDVTMVQANPDAAAIGKMVRKTLQDRGQWETLQNAVSAEVTTVTEVCNQIKVGAADVGVVYDAVLHDYPELEAVSIAELKPIVSPIAVAVLTSSQRSVDALHLARFITAEDRGLQRYEQHGFQTAGGDKWAEAPELNVFAGSMLRPAIEDTIVQFEQREGVQISRVYNGCGILVGQMQAGQRPDVYFACDVEFMQQVEDLFPEPVDVSENELVILVQKGNPYNIATLRDLSREGLRVGIGHEKQCAMGWLTQNTLQEGGVQQEVMENVTVQTPTGDMLVNQMLTGSLDAAVVYLSNAAGAGEKLDAIRIQGLECSIATQPFAIADECEHQQLAIRLFQMIGSGESRETFEAEGFRWQLKND